MAEVRQQARRYISQYNRCTYNASRALVALNMISIIVTDMAVVTGYLSSSKCTDTKDLELYFCVATSIVGGIIPLVGCAGWCFLWFYKTSLRLVGMKDGVIFRTAIESILANAFLNVMNLYVLGVLSQPVVSIVACLLPKVIVHVLFFTVYFYINLVPLIVVSLPVIGCALVLQRVLQKLQAKLNIDTNYTLNYGCLSSVAGIVWIGISILSFMGKFNDINKDYGLNIVFAVNYYMYGVVLDIEKQENTITAIIAQGVLVVRLLSAIGNLMLGSKKTSQDFKEDIKFFLIALNFGSFFSAFPRLREMLTYVLNDLPLGFNGVYFVAGLVPMLSICIIFGLCVSAYGPCIGYFVRKKTQIAVDKLINIFSCMLNCCNSTKASCLNLFSKSANDAESSDLSVMSGLRSAESVITTPRGSRNCCASLFSFCSSRQRYRRASDVTVLTGMRSEESFDLEYGNGAGLALAKAQ